MSELHRDMPRLGAFAAEVSPCAIWAVQRWRNQLERVSISGSLPVGLELNQEARILLRLSTPLQAPKALGRLALFPRPHVQRWKGSGAAGTQTGIHRV